MKTTSNKGYVMVHMPNHPFAIFKRIKQAVGFQKKSDFSKLAGYVDLLEIVRRAESSQNAYNLGFQGGPGTGKTLILEQLEEEYGEKCVFYDGSCTTAPGLLDELQQKIEEGAKIEVIIIDEVDKMSLKDQKQLLSLFEGGKARSTKVKAKYKFEMAKLKVFVSMNDEDKLDSAFKSRFKIMYLPEYSYEQFKEIVKMILKHLPNQLIEKLAYTTWYKLDNHDVREARSIGYLLKPSDNDTDIDRIIQTNLKYGKKQ